MRTETASGISMNRSDGKIQQLKAGTTAKLKVAAMATHRIRKGTCM